MKNYENNKFDFDNDYMDPHLVIAENPFGVDSIVITTFCRTFRSRASF